MYLGMYFSNDPLKSNSDRLGHASIYFSIDPPNYDS